TPLRKGVSGGRASPLWGLSHDSIVTFNTCQIIMDAPPGAVEDSVVALLVHVARASLLRNRQPARVGVASGNDGLLNLQEARDSVVRPFNVALDVRWLAH